MTITRADVADLRVGDVVEYAGHNMLRGGKVVGPLYESLGDLLVGGYVVRFGADRPPEAAWGDLTLTLISRAKPPLYVNSDKRKPDAGDVVRDADDDSATGTWTRNRPGFSFEWLSSVSHNYVPRSELPARLRLLVDGRTGQVVP